MLVNHSVHFSTNRSYETRQPGIDNSTHRDCSDGTTIAEHFNAVKLPDG